VKYRISYIQVDETKVPLRHVADLGSEGEIEHHRFPRPGIALVGVHLNFCAGEVNAVSQLHLVEIDSNGKAVSKQLYPSLQVNLSCSKVSLLFRRDFRGVNILLGTTNILPDTHVFRSGWTANGEQYALSSFGLTFAACGLKYWTESNKELSLCISLYLTSCQKLFLPKLKRKNWLLRKIT
jgi:hypothetical protein